MARRCCTLVLLTLYCAMPAHAGDWPQWRGPDRDGVWHDSKLPEGWTPSALKPLWRRPMGGGFGGIAVAAGRLYVMDRQKTPNEMERVLCLDAASGKEIWQHRYPVAYGKLDYGNGPRTTPTVHAGRVYTFGAVGHLCCLDAADGKLIWQKDTVKDLQGRCPTWGHSCSPLYDAGRLLVQIGAADGCLAAFDAATGKEIWRTLKDRPGYCSPIRAVTPGWQQILYWTAEHIAGIEPEMGKVLWQVPFQFEYDVAITDVVFHDGIVLASNYWTGSKALALDAQGRNPKIAWEGKALSLLMSTPLARGGHIYAIDRFRGLKCLEMKTGKVKWEGEFVVRRGDHNPQATLVQASERTLILNDSGELILARLSPEKFTSLGKAAVIPGRVWAHPAYANGRLFARNEEEIVCVPLVGNGAASK